MAAVSAVFDSSAILAIFNAEPGSGEAMELVEGAAVSAVNLAEVITKLLEWDMPENKALEYLTTMNMEVRPFANDSALETGRLRSLTRHRGLSLGDRACLATALTLGAPAVTTDRNWQALDIGVEIRVIR